MGFFFKNPNYIAIRIKQLQALWVMIPTFWLSTYSKKDTFLLVGCVYSSTFPPISFDTILYQFLNISLNLNTLKCYTFIQHFIFFLSHSSYHIVKVSHLSCQSLYFLFPSQSVIWFLDVDNLFSFYVNYLICWHCNFFLRQVVSTLLLRYTVCLE